METSLPTSCGSISRLGKESTSPSLESSPTIPTESANKSHVSLHYAPESWRYTARGEANAELQRSFTRPRVSVHDLDLDRSLSPPLSTVDSSFDHDSDEDGETAPPAYQAGPRIGPNFQADLDDLYSADIAEDNSILLWDPDTMSDDDLDLLMAQCNVSDSTLAAVTSSSTSTTNLHTVSSIPIQSSCDSEAFTASTSSLVSTSEPAGHITKILPLEHWLQLVHDSRYDSAEVVSQQKKRGFFGWSARQSMFAVWSEDEMSLFELAMASFPKNFDQIAHIVKTRSVGECAEFYYGWKHTARCRAWRGQVVEPEVEEPQPVFHSRMLPNAHAVPHPSSGSKKRKREPEALLDSSERLYLEAIHSFENPELMLNIILDAPNTLAEEVAATALHSQAPAEVELNESTHHVTNPSETSMLHHSRCEIAAASPKRAKMAEPDEPQLIHSISSDMLIHSAGNLPVTINPSTILSDLFSPAEPTMDFFMHF